jgi:hypothetical protein
MIAGSPLVLPLDGEGGPKRSFGSEGVKPGACPSGHLAATPSTPPSARSFVASDMPPGMSFGASVPIKGKDGWSGRLIDRISIP